MNRKTRGRWLLASALAIHFAPACAQGIPVIDAANLLQAIHQLQAWEQQWLQMQQQLQQQLVQIQTATRHLDSTTGSRGLGTVENGLPGPSLSAEFPAALAATTTHADAARLVDVQARRISASTTQRFRQIQALMTQINQTTDSKGAQEINARIAAEQAMIATEQKELEQLQQSFQAQLAAIDRAHLERERRALSQPLRAPGAAPY